MDIMTALNAAGQAVGLIRAATQTLDEAKIISATNELNSQLIQLGAEVIAMQKDGVQATERERKLLARIHELEDSARQLEKRISDRERYELVEAHPGTFTLRLRELSLNGEPMHHLCPRCLDNNQVKSILQFTSPEKIYADCPVCKHQYQLAADHRVMSNDSYQW
nr:MAG TPA: zinc-ribbon domain protein [Caudoviricetes sp.]